MVITPQHQKLLNERRKTAFRLDTLFDAPGNPTGANASGVAIASYGQGQITGAIYTVPAHGEITVNFGLHLVCVTPADVQNLSNLIRSLLDASHQHLYDEISKTDISGGASFFGFFSAGISASYSDTKHTMDSWGLSEANQQTIVQAMMALSEKTSDFNYTGTVYNRDYDYDVTGSMFGIVMDATITQNSQTNQLRFLAPQPHLQGTDGTTTLPTVGTLY